MIPLPDHLKEIVLLEKDKENTVTLSLKCCRCNCNSFFLHENHPTKEEKALLKPYREALNNWYPKPKDGFPGQMTRDENGVWHYWKILSADGLKREEVFIPKQPPFATVKVIKAVCCECQQEYILFDSRLHGYDGIVSDHSEEELEYSPHYRLKNQNALKVILVVENDTTLDTFVSNTGVKLNEQDYSNAYSWITIYGIDDSGKKKKLFEFETA